jgi:hypothetical protein
MQQWLLLSALQIETARAEPKFPLGHELPMQGEVGTLNTMAE